MASRPSSYSGSATFIAKHGFVVTGLFMFYGCGVGLLDTLENAKNALSGSASDVSQSSPGDIAPVALQAPSVLSLAPGLYTPSLAAQTTIVVGSPVEAGDLINLYTSPTCATDFLIQSQVATGSTVSFGPLALNVGPTTFYVNREKNSQTSACSTAFITVQRKVCPSAMWVGVPKNESVGTNQDFCVMKTEAKQGAGNVAVPAFAGAPWTGMTQSQAKTYCTSLGSGYALISNAQWMTLARNIDQQPSNWVGGTVGGGLMYRGHSDNNPPLPGGLAISDPILGYDGTGNSSLPNQGPEQRRTFNLSTGETIWDLSGNVAEWIDLISNVNQRPHEVSGSQASTEQDYTIDFTNFVLIPAYQFYPSGHRSWNHLNNGIGKFLAGNSNNPGVSFRGGYNGASNIGLYQLWMNAGSSLSGSAYGFRCTYTP